MIRVRFLLWVLSLTLLTATGAQALQQLSWDDLTFPIDPADDLYESLSFEHQIDLGQLAYAVALRAAGERVDVVVEEMAERSRRNLEDAGFDIAVLLEKEEAYNKLFEKSTTTLRVYCGPVLRHPSELIQAANFRPSTALCSSRH